MFAAQRALVFLDQQGGLVGHLAELSFAFRFLDVDDGSQVQLARADMGMIDTTQAEVIKHRSEVGHIGGQFLGCHGCVFNDADGFGIAFHAGKQAQTCLTQAPHLADLGAIDA